MITQTVAEPINTIPIGPKAYAVRQITHESIARLRPWMPILAGRDGALMSGELARAFIAVIRELVDGEHPELTDEYITSWLSQALATMVAKEYERQFFTLMNYPRA